MERKKFKAGLLALIAGLALSVGSAFAQGYTMGDPYSAKLLPYATVAENMSTIVGMLNTSGDGPDDPSAFDITVHIVVFSSDSVEALNIDKCLSPWDFGVALAIQGGAQEVFDNLPEHRRIKTAIISVDEDLIEPEGYVTFTVSAIHSPHSSCASSATISSTESQRRLLYTWAILQDVGTGFFGTEIPMPSVEADPFSGHVTGPGPGLMSKGTQVAARFDVNEAVGSQTDIFIWLGSNADPDGRSQNIQGFLDCEDELEISTTIPAPVEVNVYDPNEAFGIGQCKLEAQFRGVLRFAMPDSGFIWSHISQQQSNYKMNFLGLAK